MMVDLELQPRFGEHRVGEVGDRHAHVTVAEVDPQERPGGAVQREQHRRPAALGAAGGEVDLALDDQPARLEVGHEARDRGPRKARLPGDLGPAHGAAAT